MTGERLTEQPIMWVQIQNLMSTGIVIFLSAEKKKSNYSSLSERNIDIELDSVLEHFLLLVRKKMTGVMIFVFLRIEATLTKH
jgi:hypothetical protein